MVFRQQRLGTPSDTYLILYGIIKYAKIVWNWALILINKVQKDTKEETLAMWEAHIAFCIQAGLRIHLTFCSQDRLHISNAANNYLDSVL